MSRENLETIREFYQRAATGDRGCTFLLDNHIEWVESEVPGVFFSGSHRGRDAVFDRVIATGLDQVEHFRFDIDEMFDCGDRVISTGHLRGRWKESGRELSVPFAHFWTVRDGCAIRFRGYTDTAKLPQTKQLAGG